MAAIVPDNWDRNARLAASRVARGRTSRGDGRAESREGLSGLIARAPRERTRWFNSSRATVLLLLVAATAFADAPARSPKPKRPRVVASPSPAPIAEPFDLVPTDPPEEVPPPPLLIPSPPPPPTSIEKANARPFRVTTMAGALATLTGDTGTDITPTFWIETDGPIAFGSDRSIGRLGARIGLSSSPGQTFNAADVKTYRAAEVGLWAGYVIGHFRDVDTTVVAEAGFASRMKGAVDPAPRDKLVHSAGIGLRFDARKSNASMTVLGGFDEASATCTSVVVCTGVHSGFAAMVRGQVPIVQGAVLFTGDVVLSVGGSASYFKRRDIMRIGAVIDPVAAVKVIRGR